MTDNRQTVYDDKVNLILDELESGKSRAKLAEEMGYSTWKSLDMYMRRRGFKFDGDNYISNQKNDKEDQGVILDEIGSKEILVISLLNNGNRDLKEIALKAGFSDYEELANYMEKRGFKWSSEKNNYVRKNNLEEGKIVKWTKGEKRKESTEKYVPENEIYHGNGGIPSELIKYLPILEELYQNKEELKRLLNKEVEKVPRYTIPGDAKSKNLYISNRIISLLDEYSDIKNVTKREVVEGALIEYFRRYGFEEQTDALLDI